MNSLEYFKNFKNLDFYLAPLLSGVVVAGLTYGMVYVDALKMDGKSKKPILDRPNRSSQMLSLGYVGAVASGLIVTLIMCVNS